MVTTDGWVKSSETKASDLLEALNQIGVQTVVYTDISRDGAMTGPNIDALVEANTVFSGTIIASGGISCTEDLVALRQAGIRDAIVGKALYEGAIDLK
ncbi:Histidine biosynthesis protein like protein, partial [Aduncisulcus paluster]